MKQNKRIYVAPNMSVVELKSRQSLLVGSVRSKGFDDYEEVDMSNDYE